MLSNMRSLAKEYVGLLPALVLYPESSLEQTRRKQKKKRKSTEYILR